MALRFVSPRERQADCSITHFLAPLCNPGKGSRAACFHLGMPLPQCSAFREARPHKTSPQPSIRALAYWLPWPGYIAPEEKLVLTTHPFFQREGQAHLAPESALPRKCYKCRHITISPSQLATVAYASGLDCSSSLSRETLHFPFLAETKLDITMIYLPNRVLLPCG